MLTKLIRFFRGYLRIRISGNSIERFLNACNYKGIYLWNITPVKNSYEMNISIQDFHKLKLVIRKTKTKVIILKKYGIPFYLHKYRKRKMFLIGIFFCISLMLLLSKFIWEIELKGNSTYTDEVILESLKEQGIETGILVRKIDCSEIVSQLREKFDGIIWVSASIEGSQLTIQVKENEDSITEDNTYISTENSPYDIVASEDCVISEMIVRNGVPMVKEGDTVKKGEILISGQVPVYNDAKEIIDYQYYYSDADIIGKTTISYEDSCSYTYNKKKMLDIEKQEYFLKIGKHRISLGNIENNYNNFEEYSKQYQLKLSSSFQLPLFYGKRMVLPYEQVEKSYSEKEVQKMLTDNFNYHCKELEKKGVVILQNDVKIYTESDRATAKGTLYIEKPIGEHISSTLYPIPENNNQQSGEESDGNDGSNN